MVLFREELEHIAWGRGAKLILMAGPYPNPEMRSLPRAFVHGARPGGPPASQNAARHRPGQPSPGAAGPAISSAQVMPKAVQQVHPSSPSPGP